MNLYKNVDVRTNAGCIMVPGSMNKGMQYHRAAQGC